MKTWKDNVPVFIKICRTIITLVHSTDRPFLPYREDKANNVVQVEFCALGINKIIYHTLFQSREMVELKNYNKTYIFAHDNM